MYTVLLLFTLLAFSTSRQVLLSHIMQRSSKQLLIEQTVYHTTCKANVPAVVYSRGLLHHTLFL